MERYIIKGMNNSYAQPPMMGGPYQTGQWSGGDWGFGSLGMGPEAFFLLGAIAAPFIIVAILWAIVWKGLALWHSARRGQYWWFGIMLVVNTFGILEIIYLFFVAKIKVADLFSTRSGHHSN